MAIHLPPQATPFCWFFFAGGRAVLELDRKLAPMAVENFRCLCTGEKGLGKQGKPLHFKGSKIHKGNNYTKLGF